MRQLKLLMAAGIAVLLSGTAVAQRANLPEVQRFTAADRPVVKTNDRIVFQTPGITGNETRPVNIDKLPLLDEKKNRSILALGAGDSVGFTYYDFQTNAAMPDRIIHWPGQNGFDGIEATMIWMASSDQPPEYPNRGTHLALLSGGQWTAIPQWERLEATRTGFCELDHFNDNGIIIASHKNDNTGIIVMSEQSPGTGSFNYITIPGSANGLWPKITVDGQNVTHVVWTYQTRDPVTNLPDPDAGKLKYSRSLDRGFSWSTPIDLAGVGTLPSVNGGDAYAMDANGSHLVIWYHTTGIQIVQFYSDNSGDSFFPATIVSQATYQHRYFSHSDPDSVIMPDPTFGDTATGYRTEVGPAPASSMDVMITDQGVIHGMFPVVPTYVTRYFLNGTEADTTVETYRVGTIYRDAIESYTDIAFVYHQDDVGAITQRVIPLPAGVDNSAEFYQDRFFQAGLARWPQMGMDDEGGIYLVYGSGKPGDVVKATPVDSTTERTFYYSHIYTTYSLDNGNTWFAPRDQTADGVDAQFPSLADYVDDKLYMAYQIDTYPGDYLTSSDTASGWENHPLVTSNVEFVKYNTNELSSVGTERYADAVSGLLIQSVSPNPTNGLTEIAYSVGRNGTITIKLYNTLGQVVQTLAEGTRSTGEYTSRVDLTGLQNGMYYITIAGNGGSSTLPVTVMK